MATLSAVVILAAGQGTRMKSEKPKVLHDMCGRTLLGHAIAYGKGLEPENIVVVVRHERDKVASHALECDSHLIIADQYDIKGTGRAVWCGLNALPAEMSGSILVMAGDTPLLGTDVLSELVARHEGNAVTVLSARVPDPHGYGRIVRDKDGIISGIVEHKDATEEQRNINEINTSTYVFDVDFLRSVINNLGTNNAQGEVYLTDVVAKAYEAGRGVGSYIVPDYRRAEGCNDLVQLATLRADMNRRIVENWMRAGVSIIDPATTYVDVQVTMEHDARIEPGTVLRGATHIGAHAHIGPGEFDNVQVGQGAVARHVYLRDTTIDSGETVLANYYDHRS